MNYLCKNCHSLIGNHGDEIYKMKLQNDEQLSFKTFKRISNYQEDKHKKYDFFSNLYCEKCNQEVGLKIDREFALYNCALEEQPTKITVGVFSLKQELLQQFKLDNRNFLQSNFTLLKKELNHFDPDTSLDGAVILHMVEQRVLLVGVNGLYNELIQRLWKATAGNVILILYGIPSEIQQDFIQNVANQGQQPVLVDLQQRGHLFFDDVEPLRMDLPKFKYKRYNNIFRLAIPSPSIDITVDKEGLLKYHLIRLHESKPISRQNKILCNLLRAYYDQSTSPCALF